MPTYYATADTPVGAILLVGDSGGLRRLVFPTSNTPSKPDDGWIEDTRLMAPAVNQLREYFTGKRTSFDLLLSISGTAFERSVWAALRRIPFGKTVSYTDIAISLGKPKATRAVGRANSKNPLPIFIPCHRVIGANGKLTGFSGGLGLKRTLLQHERTHHREGGVQMQLL